jgi:DNA polymerase epsilon subunit 3
MSYFEIFVLINMIFCFFIRMAERPEDLNLPITVVQRIVKEALPDGVVVAKEARQAISRASSVFVLYLTSCAITHSLKSKRKTLAVNDILAALEDMEFDSFIGPLNEALKARKESLSAIKSKKQTDKTIVDSKEDDDEEEEGDVDDVVEHENIDNEEQVIDAEEESNDNNLSLSETKTKKRKIGDGEDEIVNIESTTQDEKSEESDDEDDDEYEDEESEHEDLTANNDD